MKVLQINTVCGYGSTGSIAADIASLLEKKGHQCYIAYGQGSTSLKNSYKIGSKLENHLHNIYSRLFGKQGYYSKHGTEGLIRYINNIKPEIIHLHNLHGNYINLEILFNYLSKADIPVVWTLHDCWAFTGKCAHYVAAGCYKWKKQCFQCPLYKVYPPSMFFDKSKELFIDKKEWFTSIKRMIIVPVSKWLAHEVSQSFLSKYPIHQIYNWVDYKKFSVQAEDVRSEYGIHTDQFTILSVSAEWTQSSNRYLDAIKLAKILPENTQLVLVGKRARGTTFPDNIIHIPYINGTKELAKLYSIADVFIHFSVEDTFGKVIAEAMACGTPVIVFNSTACPELVGKDCGYIVAPHDIQGIADAVNKITKNGKNIYSAQCVSYVRNNFDYQTNAGQFVEVYQEMLK